jgi:PmbA protein
MESFEEGLPRDLDWAEALVEEALLAGAAEAEVYAKTSATTGIFLSEGFATMAGGLERGIALRVFDGNGNFGHACSSWADGDHCREMITSSLEALRVARTGPAGSIFPASRPERGFPAPEGMVDPKVTLWSPQEKREMLEGALREASWEGSKGAAATYRDGISRIVLANSRGLRAGYARTLSLVNLVRSGSGGPTTHGEWVSTGPEPAGVMETAASRARIRSSAGDEEIVAKELLLEAAAATSLVHHLLPDLIEGSGGADSGGGDFKRLASEAVTVVDDGLLAGGIATAPFDGEGNPTGRVTLVKAGVRIERLRPVKQGESGRPGCAARPSYRDLPAPAGTNLFLLPGSRRLGEILEHLEEGFLLASLEGDIREKAGEGSSRWRGVGWQVGDGRCVGPCRRIVFRAEPADLLEGILELSDRVRFSLRRGMAVGTPDLLIRPRR